MIEETEESGVQSRALVFINICAGRLFPFVCLVSGVVVLGVISKQWVSGDIYRWLERGCGVVAVISVLCVVARVAKAWTDSFKRVISFASPVWVSVKIIITLVGFSALLAFGYTVL